MVAGVQMLREYLRRSQMTQRAFANQVGITETFLSQVLIGIRGFSLETAVAVEDVTGIPARSWQSRRLNSAKGRKSQSSAKRLVTKG